MAEYYDPTTGQFVEEVAPELTYEPAYEPAYEPEDEDYAEGFALGEEARTAEIADYEAEQRERDLAESHRAGYLAEEEALDLAAAEQEAAEQEYIAEVGGYLAELHQDLDRPFSVGEIRDITARLPNRELDYWDVYDAAEQAGIGSFDGPGGKRARIEAMDRRAKERGISTRGLYG
jgi:hypothetical protein